MTVFTCVTAGNNIAVNFEYLDKCLYLAYIILHMNPKSILYSAVMVIFQYVTAEYKERRAQC